MIIAVLVVAGLCFGSFVNAVVWRLRQQSKRHPENPSRHPELVSGSRTKISKSLSWIYFRSFKSLLKGERGPEFANALQDDDLSIINGRSMCPNCKHKLAAKDLIPLFSWLSLKGKCRYCHTSISAQYPLVELATAALFVASYIWWPAAFSATQITIFVLWLMLLVGLMALLVYDVRWFLLPNKIIYPLSVVAIIQAIIVVAVADNPFTALLNIILAVLFGGGLFYLLFQISGGKWIGGGDVKLGWLLGLILGTPARSLLFIFIGAVLGSLVSLPLLATNRLKRTSVIPFGPFLIIAAVIVQLFGADMLHWYHETFLNLQ